MILKKLAKDSTRRRAHCYAHCFVRGSKFGVLMTLSVLFIKALA